MATYYVDDGGSATSPFDTWAKAATSLAGLLGSVTIASSDTIYIGHDHVEPSPPASAVTFMLPAANPPVYIISATSGSNPVAYQASTTDQIKNTGINDMTFDGAVVLVGIKISAGRHITFACDGNEAAYCYNCTFGVGNAGYVRALSGGVAGWYRCTIDLSQDASPSSQFAFGFGNGFGYAEVVGLSFVSASNRTGVIFNNSGTSNVVRISGSDFSGFTNATDCEIASGAGAAGHIVFSNCKTKSGFTYTDGAIPQPSARLEFYNVGDSDSPSRYALFDYYGSSVSTDQIYRTSGASIENVSSGWLVTTTGNCSETACFRSSWMCGYIDSTGSKTFDVYIVNDDADFDDDEVWLEVEYMGTSDSPLYTIGSDQRATITTTPAAQTDDTTSTWNGTGPSFTYKQKLSVTATVNETGQYRARVCVGVASIASSRYFYIDPKVNVS